MDAVDEGAPVVVFAGLAGAYWLDDDDGACPGCCSLSVSGGGAAVLVAVKGRAAVAAWGARPSGPERVRTTIVTVAVATVISGLLMTVFS